MNNYDIGFRGNINVNGNVNLTKSGSFQINGISVLTNNSLGPNVVSSGLTTLGTLSNLNVSGPTIMNNMTASNITANNLILPNNNFTANNLIIQNASIGSLSVNTGTLPNIFITNHSANNLYTKSLYFMSSNITSGTMSTLLANTSNINTLYSTNNVVDNSIASIYGIVSNLNVISTSSIGNLYATNATFGSINITNSSVANFNANIIYYIIKITEV
jgi:hypothetical protein